VQYRGVVVRIATELKLLDAAGDLKVNDSLALLDLVAELETVTELSIPTSEMRADTFASIDNVVALLDRLAARPDA
jgi:acyl carrier protein